MDKNIIYETLKEHLVSYFEVDPALISIEKLMEDDLGLDSLDMVEMLNCLKNNIGDNIEPGLFKNARTLQDAVDLLEPLWKQLH